MAYQLVSKKSTKTALLLFWGVTCKRKHLDLLQGEKRWFWNCLMNKIDWIPNREVVFPWIAIEKILFVYFFSTKRQELDILLSTVKHEMLHALGFSVSLFAFYRDKDGNPLTPRGENGKPKLNEE